MTETKTQTASNLTVMDGLADLLREADDALKISVRTSEFHGHRHCSDHDNTRDAWAAATADDTCGHGDSDCQCGGHQVVIEATKEAAQAIGGYETKYGEWVVADDAGYTHITIID